MSNVVDIADFRKKQDRATDEWLDECEEMEMDVNVKMHQSMDAHIHSVSEIYGIHPALVAEFCMGGTLAILGKAIEDHDSGAAKDVLNWLHEITGEMLDSHGVRMGRDQDERLDWRDDTYRHRWEQPATDSKTDKGDSDE